MSRRLSLALFVLTLVACNVRKPGPRDQDGSIAPGKDADLYQFPLSDAGLLIDVPFGRPAAELVYDLGARQGNFAPMILLIDGDAFYWVAGSSRIFRASRDGAGVPEEIAQCLSPCLSPLASDATHLYWLERNTVRRRSKQLAPIEDVTLQWDHSGGAVAVGAQYAYASMPGCAAITRVDKRTLTPETMYSPTPRDVGDTRMVVADDGTLYCASWSRLLRISEWGRADLLYQGPHKGLQETELCAVQVTKSHIFWLDRGSAGGGHGRIGKLPLAGGEPLFLKMPTSGHVSNLEYDGGSTLLFFRGDWIASVDLEIGTLAYLAKDFFTDIAAAHGRVYWSVRDPFIQPGKGDWGAIRSLPVTSTPALVFPDVTWSSLPY